MPGSDYTTSWASFPPYRLSSGVLEDDTHAWECRLKYWHELLQNWRSQSSPRNSRHGSRVWKSPTCECKCGGDNLFFAKRKANRCCFLSYTALCVLRCTTKLTFLEGQWSFLSCSLIQPSDIIEQIVCIPGSPLDDENTKMSNIWFLTSKIMQSQQRNQIPADSPSTVASSMLCGRGGRGKGFLAEGSTKPGWEWGSRKEEKWESKIRIYKARGGRWRKRTWSGRDRRTNRQTLQILYYWSWQTMQKTKQNCWRPGWKGIQSQTSGDSRLARAFYFSCGKMTLPDWSALVHGLADKGPLTGFLCLKGSSSSPGQVPFLIHS